MVGSTVLHYQIVEKIGAGGMGEIYKARDPRLNRFVAIKVLAPNIARDDDRRRRFFQEAQAASALNHPNIITIYDIIPDGPVECIVMEYVAGKTLAELTPNTGMSAALVLKLGVQIASALSAAHAAGIVHRDLKPGNIMVTEAARVKVLDFGLAKLMDSGPVLQTDDTRTVMGKPMTVEGSIIGTVSYMSPEQAQGKRIDARTDIFSFGTVLYEMATGRRAFDGENTLSTLTAVLRDDIRPVTEFVPNSPPEFDQIIRQCMRKRPDDRFQSMAEVEVSLTILKAAYDSGNYAQSAAPSSEPYRPTYESLLNSPPSSHYGGASQIQPPGSFVAQPGSMIGGVGGDPYQQGGGYDPSQSQPYGAQQDYGQAQDYGQQQDYGPPSGQTMPPSAGPKKKGSSLGLIAGIVLVVLAGAGGGAWYFLKDKAQPKPPEPVAVTQTPAAQTPAAPPEAVPAAPSADVPPATQAPATPGSTIPSKPSPAPGKADSKAQQKAAEKAAAEAKAAADAKNAAKAPEVKPAPPPPAPAPAPVVVPAPVAAPTRLVPVPDGTPFTVTLAEDVSAEAEEGLPLRFVATADLKVGGAIVMAKGAPVTGAIFEGKKKGGFLGRSGKMTLRMLQAQMVDGRKINVRATSGTRGDGPARRQVEVPGGSKSKDMVVSQGAQYIAYIDGDVVVSVKQ